ncbi:uncharacterized protein LOC135170322 [Diachasmimorpha longicaudata]|uniref:uncharacterized protein LOC135170322 n=1 Tax=Diachasmimorpha longicaudata TaxID=58733 RepID=UPI0030B908A4
MAHLRSLLVAIALVVCAGATPLPENDFSITRAEPEVRGDPKVYRLPTDVVPVSYTIKLEPDFDSGNFTFTGVSEITINVLTKTDKITLHASNLTIAKSELRNAANVLIETKCNPLNPTNDFLIINLTQVIAPGTYKLKLEYEGKLNDDLKGFYRSSYVDDYGKKRWLATTQFEPTHARSAFPCWDEPHLKAKFSISIKHPERLNAISNMPKSIIIPDSSDLSKLTTTFSTTPNMSTYLVAFVVSDFSALSNSAGSFKIWARPNAIRHGSFALNIGEKELEALGNFTNIPFKNHEFPKMDSVAIPQFAAGAMENWGLVTYRESALLVDENVTTIAGKESVASIISHEFAHQWFGNLVSPKWWQYTWLNEGFATYFQYVITDLILPEWRLKDLQVVKALQSAAFPADSVSTAVDMNYDVNSQVEIKAKFNSISYQKAGSVIRMINHVVGEDKFKAALQAYLTAMKFSAATSDDLFKEFKKVAPKFTGTTTDPITIFNNWANTPGFPTINVTRNYVNGTVNIVQERYLYKPDGNHTERYYVPLNYAMKKEDFATTTVTNWLEKDKAIENLDVKAVKDKWIIFNKQHFGYYRVNYDEQNWKLITAFLKTKNYTDIHVLNRGQLVDDALSLARNGKLKWDIALDLMAFLKQDFDYVSWTSALTGFSHLQRTLFNTASYASFKAYLLDLLEPVFKTVKFYESPEDLYLTKLLRVSVLDWACKLGSKPCRDQALQNLTKWLQDSTKNPLPPNLKNTIICAGIRNADQATWDKIYAKQIGLEEKNLLGPLGCSSNVNILKSYLSKAMNESIAADDRDEIFEAVISRNDEGVNVALDFILANADKIYQVSGNSTEKLKSYITKVGSRINNKAQHAKLIGAANAHVKSVSADGVSKAQENLDWLATHEPAIIEHYKQKDTPPKKPNSAVTGTISFLLFIVSFSVSRLYAELVTMTSHQKIWTTKMMKIKFISFLLLIISALSQSSTVYTPTKYEEQLIAKVIGYRLPNTTVPRLYTLNLEPHIDDKHFSFDGTSSTLFEVLDATWSVTVHASTLIEIDKTYTTLIHSDGTIEKPVSQRYNEHLQFFSLKFNHSLDIGNYTVRMKWKGHDYGSLRGFYRAENRNTYGETQYMVATHFEPLAARSAFPCWDEPGLKAEFDISLKHHSNYTALSNMPMKEQTTDEDGKIWTSFQRTPVMSTYLATFVIAPYTSRRNDHGNITFWVPSDELSSAAIGFEVTSPIVTALENYTGIPYSLPKLDAVYVPEYSSSATEHWGLIAYSGQILVDPNRGDHRRLNAAILLAAHEITHQWLGNLVTPAWWSDLWLSEAFAVYMSAKIVDEIIPEFHAVDLFAIEMVNQVSFRADYFRDKPHPIRWEPETPEEVYSMFSPVTYRKGAAVVRMLEHIITEEALRHGIRKYVDKHQLGSVETNDLWRSLQESYNELRVSPHLNIKTLMNPWLEQTGYPLLNVTRDYETGFVSITQSDAVHPESGNLWTIPINYATTSRPDFSSTRPTHFMRRANHSLILDRINRNDGIILNIQQTGFYRVNYDWENWNRISAYLNSENYHKIHVLNRAQLLHDVVHFSTTDERYCELLMDMLMYLRRETNYLPWTIMPKLIERFALPLMNTPNFEFFRNFMLHIMNNMIEHIGFTHRPSEDNNLLYLARGTLFPFACNLGHEGCRAEAPLKLMEILNGRIDEAFHNQYHGWIYCTALADANETLWNLVMSAHWANPREHRAFQALGCTKNHRLIRKYLALAFAENATLLSDDVYEGLSSMISGPAGNYDFALDYFIENIDQIRQYLNERNSTREIWYLCKEFAQLAKTQNQFEKLTRFLNKETEDGKISNVRELIDTARESLRESDKVSTIINSIRKRKPYLLTFIEN